MLEFFRKLGQTRGSKVFLSLLALSFVGWGVSGYLVHVTGESAVTVGDEEVSVQQLDAVYRQKVSAMTQMLGHAPTPEELEQTRIAENVLTDAVARAVLRQSAANLGLLAPVKALQEEIAANPMFRNDNGGFDPARYRALLARAGRSPEQFEQEMSQDLSVRLLGEMVRVAPALPAALTPQAALDGATLELDVATIPAGIDTGKEPTADDLKRQYDLNQKLYEKPEKRSFSVLEISKDSIGGTVTIPPERVAKEYEDNKANFVVPEKRVVRHILVETEAKANEIAAKIKTVEDFAREANAQSKDPGNAGGKGGELGAIAKDSVVPEFSEVAFAAQPGSLSKPVKTAYGWHLIWVEKVEPGHTQTLAEVKDQIEKQLRDTESEDALNTLLQSVDEKVAGGESLTKVAQEVGLKAEPVAMITARDQTMPAEIVQGAFATEMGQTSAPINLKDGGVAYVQVTAVVPANVPPLDEIKERVTTDWKNLQRQLAGQAASDKVLTAARSQAARSMADAVAQSGVAGVKVESMTVKDLAGVPQWLHKVLLEVFQLPEGGTLNTVVGDTDGWRVVKLTKRTLDKPDAKTLEANAEQFHQRLQADVEALVVAELQRKAKVTCHQARLRQLFGRDIACGF